MNVIYFFMSLKMNLNEECKILECKKGIIIIIFFIVVRQSIISQTLK